MDDTTLAQLPQYQSHKKVWALKILQVDEEIDATDDTPRQVPRLHVEAGFAPVQVTAEYIAKHNPQAGGYWVRYEDGYESYSPAKAFEEGYSRIG